MSKFLGGVLQGNETVFLTQDEINNPYADIPTMIEDKKRKQVQMKQTVFDRITQSPEVLAEKLVEDTMDGTMFYSILTREDYCTKERAIAATVSKLKEVEK
jgi:hypothetical protein